MDRKIGELYTEIGLEFAFLPLRWLHIHHGKSFVQECRGYLQRSRNRPQGRATGPSTLHVIHIDSKSLWSRNVT